MLTQYAQQRDRLLSQITQSLSADPRFAAAWLSGSLGRGDADEVSDLDLTVVVSKEFADYLCARPAMITARPPIERLTLFGQYGNIGFVYENNYNAPAGGTATSVMYAPSGVIIDWTLIPEQEARRPQASGLLFERLAVAATPEPTSASSTDQAKALTDTVGFFWLMAAVTAKYVIRGDHVFVVRWLEELAGLVQEAKRLIAGRLWQYRRGSITDLKVTQTEQVLELRKLCQQVEELSPQIIGLGGEVWSAAKVGLEQLLEMAEQVGSSTPGAG